MIGLDIRHTHFRETNPSDHLDLSRIHGLLRLGAAWGGYENESWLKGYWEVDMGLGMVQLKGHNRNQGVSFTLPILFHPTDWLGVEFRPAWSSIKGSRLQDYDLSLYLGHYYAGLKLGYRWLRSPTTSLNAPTQG